VSFVGSVPNDARSRPGRVVALDLGSKRIGVACTDPTQLLASPYEVLARTGSIESDHRAIRRIVDECEAVTVVVGLPISLDGRLGRAATLVTDEVEILRTALNPVPVELFDERFTTTTAHASMMERKMKADARRKVVDKVAAAVLLQAWLDARPSTPRPGAPT
jgi:putative holliday junction resolvase